MLCKGHLADHVELKKKLRGYCAFFSFGPIFQAIPPTVQGVASKLKITYLESVAIGLYALKVLV